MREEDSHPEPAPVQAAAREPTLGDRGADARASLRRGRASRARQGLTASPLAPGTAATLAELRDPEKRPPALERALSDEAARAVPPQEYVLDRELFAATVRSAPRGKAPGRSGWRFEHFRLLLWQEVALRRLEDAAQLLGRGAVPAAIAEGLALGSLTALKPRPGKIRGIVAGDALRRLVAKTIAQQYSAQIMAATNPYQFALSTRAGTDAVALFVQAWLELHPEAVLISVDGIGAFDHIYRDCMLRGLHGMAPELLPFVRMFYARQSVFLWTDANGTVHEVAQGEGGEQGDSMMPALYAMGQHGALEHARSQLHADDILLAFLDDLYAVTTRERARHVYDVVTEAVRVMAGVRAHSGKTLVFSMAGGPPPPGIADLDTPEHRVWVGDLEPHRRGLIVLGVPVGAPEFRAAALADDGCTPAHSPPTHLSARVVEERRFLDVLPAVQDPQSVWLLLRLCAEPRANHLLRTVPPSLVHAFAAAHDTSLWWSLCSLLTIDPASCSELTPHRAVRVLAAAPARYGGLGLRDAVRTSPAAYWAGWADALPVLRERLPAPAHAILRALEEGGGTSRSLREAVESATLLGEEGFSVPPWRELFDGRRPPSRASFEPRQRRRSRTQGSSTMAGNSGRLTRGSVSPWSASGRASMEWAARAFAPSSVLGRGRG